MNTKELTELAKQKNEKERNLLRALRRKCVLGQGKNHEGGMLGRVKYSKMRNAKDFELTETLARPGSLFLDDLSKAKNFSTEGYGSVLLVYVGCDQDLVITVEFQQWLIKNGEPEDLMEIKGADHMPMFSKPDELCHCLLEIAHRYA
ncbi:putative methylesterase 6 [Quercus suber]|uniref:putative methylesterase 6 n=1 Tax=Quercus suber TaxID=58331 RepID=UPI0032DF33E9